MNMKRFLALLMALVMCFVLCACGSTVAEPPASTPETTQSTQATEATQSSSVTPLLYKVTDKSGNVLWLFGSIHVGREDFYPLPEYVMDAFRGSDSLAVELDILAFEKDMSLQMQALSCLVYYDGTTIKDHISPELYEKAVNILTEYNSYMSAMDLYCPAFWGSMINTLMLTQTDADANLGIDRHLIGLAYESEKEILEIESAEEQYGILASFDDDVQSMVLLSAVQSYENKEDFSTETENLMDLWAAGDEEAFAQGITATDDSMTEEEKQLYEVYDKAMTKDRNLTMTEFAEDALGSGKEVFLCVGAAHIVGPGAMAELLAQRGYTVECITNLP